MILEPLFRLMSEKSASDVFVTAGAPIHMKLNGQSVPVNTQIITPDMSQAMAKDLMTDEQWEQFQKTKEANLSMGIPRVGNFRINLFKQRNAIAIVVRFISSNIPDIDTLGTPPILKHIIMETRGLVLVVGATGSGKSTTIASMLDYRSAQRPGHILTIEDPIEFLFRHKKSIINQREVGVDTDDWHVALKNAMRQAPDCILIGEIRDRDAMVAALSYAQSGHLVVATLHANNSYHAMNRIVNFFPMESRNALYLDLSISLKAVISQRLVPKTSGGRCPAAEVLLNSRSIAELIEKGMIPEIKEAMEKSMAPGSQTFEQDLFRLYKTGILTLDTALAASDSPSNLNWLINNSDMKFEQPVASEEVKIDDNVGSDFSDFKITLED